MIDTVVAREQWEAYTLPWAEQFERYLIDALSELGTFTWETKIGVMWGNFDIHIRRDGRRWSSAGDHGLAFPFDDDELREYAKKSARWIDLRYRGSYGL